MGGWGSGPQSGGRPLADDGLTLTLYPIIGGRGRVRRHQAWRAELHWTAKGSDRPLAQIAYSAELHETGGHVRLRYTVTINGREHPQDYSIELTTTEQPFGGRRWWFVCPYSGDTTAKLYLPPGAVEFRSRKAHGLAYRSQRETDYDRSVQRAWKAKLAMGGEVGTFLGTPVAKRKWRHWHTHERAAADLKHKTQAYEWHLSVRCCAMFRNKPLFRAWSRQIAQGRLEAAGITGSP